MDAAGGVVMGGVGEDVSWMGGLGGRLVVFDGPDGSGKSTQASRFARCARGAGLEVVEVRDPGGTAIGERVREVLLDPSCFEMDVRCELMLYMASRAQLVAEKIKPAVEGGALVVADRYVSSTLAYQGSAGGLSEDEIVSSAEAACGRFFPADLTVVFDVDQATAAHRLNPLLDRMERKGAAFHKRVREGFLAQAARWPERYVVVDARAGESEVFGAMVGAVRERCGGWSAVRGSGAGAASGGG